jgi:hypothetical protein
MVSHRLEDWGKLILKKNPNGGITIAKQSFPKGVTPEHLRSYTPKFTEAARACAADTKGMSGMEHIGAMRACIGQKLKK